MSCAKKVSIKIRETIEKFDITDENIRNRFSEYTFDKRTKFGISKNLSEVLEYAKSYKNRKT